MTRVVLEHELQRINVLTWLSAENAEPDFCPPFPVLSTTNDTMWNVFFDQFWGWPLQSYEIISLLQRERPKSPSIGTWVCYTKQFEELSFDSKKKVGHFLKGCMSDDLMNPMSTKLQFIDTITDNCVFKPMSDITLAQSTYYNLCRNTIEKKRISHFEMIFTKVSLED